MNSYSFPADIFKSGKESNGRVPITIVPSQPTKDRVNDRILLKAFDNECIKGFLKDGVLDYDHLSMLGETPLIRAQAIIGQPTKFYIDHEKAIPVCDGFLFRGNPYVDNAILPALESESKIFGASLGGKIIRKSSGFDLSSRTRLNDISKITLKHIAVTPLQKAVHQGTSIQLRKSGENDQDTEIIFSSFDDFFKSFDNPEYLLKALEAGAVTDSAQITGGQAVQQQSLEGDDARDLKAIIPFVLEAILNGQIEGGYADFMKYFMDRGLTREKADRMIHLIAINSPSIAKLIF